MRVTHGPLAGWDRADGVYTLARGGEKWEVARHESGWYVRRGDDYVEAGLPTLTHAAELAHSALVVASRRPVHSISLVAGDEGDCPLDESWVSDERVEGGGYCRARPGGPDDFDPRDEDDGFSEPPDEVALPEDAPQRDEREVVEVDVDAPDDVMSPEDAVAKDREDFAARLDASPLLREGGVFDDLVDKFIEVAGLDPGKGRLSQFADLAGSLAESASAHFTKREVADLRARLDAGLKAHGVDLALDKARANYAKRAAELAAERARSRKLQEEQLRADSPELWFRLADGGDAADLLGELKRDRDPAAERVSRILKLRSEESELTRRARNPELPHALEERVRESPEKWVGVADLDAAELRRVVRESA